MYTVDTEAGVEMNYHLDQKQADFSTRSQTLGTFGLEKVACHLYGGYMALPIK